MADTNITLLPIGTVIKVKDFKKLIMIYGRNQILEGNISEQFNVFFNRNMGEDVIYPGYESPQEVDMREKVELEIKKLKRNNENVTN
ncbi:DUF4176 domain-containing protein [Fictibacillus phosphorivorans]|uniref:DUF4176 domain-containing protein n=1 Tax=Fictibacillus phosphorivorans TaxID=1221500 RepID=UPI0011A87F76|nr:DUF4176 domain-containing protein [Fictibacillus phosphorivorans]